MSFGVLIATFSKKFAIIFAMAKNQKKAPISLDPYKGVRDFYPEEMFIENYLFDVMRDNAESFGYEEYNASLLEPTELYEAKSSEEIVREQTYSFEDRGGRRVTLRPEMTPTLARMVAARKRELALPLRWYAIPNCFRYERPQRGRVREHWQFNADLLGISGIEGDLEIISLATSLMEEFGATPAMYEVRINSRAVIPEAIRAILGKAGEKLSADNLAALVRVMDRKDKLSPADYRTRLTEVIGARAAKALVEDYTPERFAEAMRESEAGKHFFSLLEALPGRSIRNVRHDINLVRGFDYYTGTIFEIFDRSPENPRALGGGGRYDHLLETFGGEAIPAVGFGMGDVTLRDFLEIHKLLPPFESVAQLALVVPDSIHLPLAHALAQRLRRMQLINTTLDISGKKLTDQFKAANKRLVPFVLIVGTEELTRGLYTIKNMVTGQEAAVMEEQIGEYIGENY